MGNDSFAKLNRESTSITISEFYERNQLGKYNFEPEYQRRGDVWDEDKQSFLIDSIMKNYPLPPIFLHQEIDSKTGATKYNIIDGKQRLTAIIRFIKDEIELPSDYDMGEFGDSRLNGKKFSELVGELHVFKMQFWRYILSVEYIDAESVNIINNVFDRLNRNGEPLEPQELRKAKYYNSELIHLVEKLSKSIDWKKLGKIRINRMQDAEFVSELIFFFLEETPTDASKRENIDGYYAKWANKISPEQSAQIADRFERDIQYISELEVDLEKYKINGVSHFYALFVFADLCYSSGIAPQNVTDSVNDFFQKLRNSPDEIDEVWNYRESMQANTRSKGQRVKRISALLSYCKVQCDCNWLHLSTYN